MFNKCIVNKIREIIPTYRYNSLKEFYSKCSLIHTKIADETIDIAIEENFEHEFELSIKYELNSESMYAIYGCMTQNGDTVPIYVHYYDLSYNQRYCCSDCCSDTSIYFGKRNTYANI